jgi:hypothetical protein
MNKLRGSGTDCGTVDDGVPGAPPGAAMPDVAKCCDTSNTSVLACARACVMLVLRASSA